MREDSKLGEIDIGEEWIINLLNSTTIDNFS